MNRDMSIGIRVGAALDKTVGKVFRSTEQHAKSLGKALSDTKKQAGTIDQFRVLKKSVAESAQEMKKAQVKVATLAKEIKATEKPTKKLSAAYAQAKKKSGQLKTAHRRQTEQLHRLRGELQDASIDTRKLGRAKADLGRKLDATRRKMGVMEKAQDRLNRKDKAAARLTRQRASAIGLLGVAYATAKGLSHDAAFEHDLRMFGNVGDLSVKQIKGVRGQLRLLSDDVNQDKAVLLGGLDFLVGKGLDTNRSAKSIATIGRSATATGASVEDLSKASFAMMDNMNISSKTLEASLDIIASSGKQGGFELRGMAQYFPVLTSQAKMLGLTGREGIATLGASLQIAMKGAGSESEAANNLQNFLAKITSKETVANLNKLGVSVKDVFNQATSEGADPIIEIIKAIDEITGGDAFKLNEIFGDMQVKNFINPMLKNMDEFYKIRSKSLNAKGVIDKDFNNIMDTTLEKGKRVVIGLVNIGDALANSVSPAIRPVLGYLGDMVKSAGDLIVKFPILGQILGVTAFLFSAATAGAIAYTSSIWLWNTATVAAMRSGLGWVASLAASGTALLISKGAVLGSALATGALTAAQWGLNVAMTANPIGLIIAGVAALAAGAYLLYDNWESVTAWFGKKLDWLTDKFGFISDAWNAIFGDEEKSVTQRIKQTIEPVKKPVMAAITAGALATAMPAYAQLPVNQTSAPAVHNAYHIALQTTPGANGAELAENMMREVERIEASRSRGAMHDRESDL